MALPLYLAMSGDEILENGVNENQFGIMTRIDALEALPQWYPCGGMLVLTDETPIRKERIHEIVVLLQRLVSDLNVESVLLDFQRQGDEGNRAFVDGVVNRLSCPLCVSEAYAREEDCALLLPPVPADVTVEEYLRPWQGREVWLEAALDGMVISVSEKGAESSALLRGEPGEGEHKDEELCCHYRVEMGERAVFTLRRTEEDLRRLLDKAQALGVSRAVGLYQELWRL